MSGFPHPWRALRNAYARRLSWKLALSHLTVALICQAIYVVGAIGIIFLAGGNLFVAQVSPDPLPSSSREMSEETRILATVLAAQVRQQSPGELSATLSRLPPLEHSGYGAFDGVLSPTNRLVIIAPDGTVRASSDAGIAAGTPLNQLAPAAWGPVLEAALRGERDSGAPTLTARDEGLRVLVTAYPIVGERGEILGALGLRSASVSTPVPPPPESRPAPLIIFASVSALVLGLLVVVGLISSAVSSVAGFVLARVFGRRLRPLAVATEAIARGDLTARVAVSDGDEIGQLGERFNLLTARLEETERARRAFVSNVSHELRTPLAIVRGHVEAQLAGGENIVPTREALLTIEHETRALGALIDDFFTLTRIEEAALTLQPVPVDLRAVAATAIAGIRPLARAQGHIAVELVVPLGLPPVLADAVRLGQILNNLLYNALRHTRDGGVIVVEAAPTADGRAIEIGVVDTGTGIAPDALPHIFDRFYRGEGASSRSGGSGLGLAIVKQLVEAQGGTVRAESVLGEGTAIRFTLPRARHE